MSRNLGVSYAMGNETIAPIACSRPAYASVEDFGQKC